MQGAQKLLGRAIFDLRLYAAIMSTIPPKVLRSAMVRGPIAGLLRCAAAFLSGSSDAAHGVEYRWMESFLGLAGANDDESVPMMRA
jgi:hypothetical protein